MGHGLARPFDRVGGGSRASAEAERGGELVAQQVQLRAHALSAGGVAEAFRLRQLVAQLHDPTAVGLAGPIVEHGAGRADARGDGRRRGGAAARREEIEHVQLVPLPRDERGDVAPPFAVPQAHGGIRERQGPQLPLAAEHVLRAGSPPPGGRSNPRISRPPA